MYNFDEINDRRNTNSYKWNIKEGELPMWVADMDFRTAPAIIEFLERKVGEGIFGYQDIPDAWNEAYQNWWKTRHHLDVERDSLIFCTGVVPAISSAVRKLTTPAEKVIVLTPVYNIFFNSIYNNGRNVVECPLKYANGSYDIDFEDFENKLSDPQVTLLIFCNPHNPVGKIWDRKTLARVGELCDKHHVLVISDEIHCDLTDPGTEYVPYASVSETCRMQSVTCIAPTKCFNLAGIQTAAVMVPNPVLRHRIWRALNTDEVAEPNAFAIGAAIAAFTKGGEWLDELREYLYRNKELVREFIERELPELKLISSQATYLLWFDCSAYSYDSVELCRQIREKTGLYLSNGAQYGQSGRSFFRMNIACPRTMVLDGLERLRRALMMNS
ncbi:MAG: pyridoxal phosphate-dependent aminotransferase [Proteobacteria bacterium]|nr:pyridoxal phosphate-dependent aminotransferase [Pseudomonadota bacterium]